MDSDAPSVEKNGSNSFGLKLLMMLGCATFFIGGPVLVGVGVWMLSKSSLWADVAQGDLFAPPPPPQVAPPEPPVGVPIAPQPPPVPNAPPPAAVGRKTFNLATARALFPLEASISERDFKARAAGLDLKQITDTLRRDCRLGSALFLLFSGKWPKDLVQIPAAPGEDDPMTRGQDRFGIFEPRHVTACVCRTSGETARGTIDFKTAFYRGKVDFVASWRGNKWEIHTFRFPESGLALTKNPVGGAWRRTDVPDDASPLTPLKGDKSKE